jgi:hypothetical protein
VAAELQTANVAYFQRKIQLPRISAHPDGSPSLLIPISGVLLYLNFKCYREITLDRGGGVARDETLLGPEVPDSVISTEGTGQCDIH